MTASEISDEVLLGWSEGCVEVHLGNFDAVSHMDAETTDRLIAELQRARRDAFGLPARAAVVLEVVQAGEKPDESGTGSLIVPSAVLINGQPVFTTSPVRVHEMQVPLRELVQVTVTLPVRLLVVGGEHDRGSAPSRGD